MEEFLSLPGTVPIFEENLNSDRMSSSLPASNEGVEPFQLREKHV